MNKLVTIVLFFSSFIQAQQENKSLTIYFNSNDYTINSNGETTINSFFSNEEIEISTITINGYCDAIGSDESNKILSVKRANSVAEYLQDNFNLEADSVEGNGEIKDIISDVNTNETRKINRRVEVIIEFSKVNNTEIKKESTVKKYYGFKSFDDKLKIGDKIMLENLVFKSSSTVFENNEIAEKELLKIELFLTKNPTAIIEIQGHVCCITKSFSDARDKDSGLNNLSETRAKRIYDYLISKGITKNCMTYAGYGRQFPIPNTEELLNKRVEVVIVKL